MEIVCSEFVRRKGSSKQKKTGKSWELKIGFGRFVQLLIKSGKSAHFWWNDADNERNEWDFQIIAE